MNTASTSKFQSIEAVMNALTVACVAIACAVVVVVSNVPGLTA